MKAVIFDMDGTIANIDERRKYLDLEVKDWESFNSKLETDTPNLDICELATLYSQDYVIVICTGRFEAVFEETETQLDNWYVPYTKILMRANGDYRKDTEVKSDMYDLMVAYGYDVKLAVDDRDSVVKMWRDKGLRCLQVAEGNF